MTIDESGTGTERWPGMNRDKARSYGENERRNVERENGAKERGGKKIGERERTKGSAENMEQA